MFKSKFYLVIAVLGVLALVAGACVQTTPAQAATGTLKLYVTDARSREEVTSIMVTVSDVRVHKALAEQEQEQEQSGTGNQTQEREQEQQRTQQGEGEWISVNIADEVRTFDLLDIEGIEQYLGQVEVEAVKYTQVRLVVEAVQVEFNDSGNLEDARIPSKELKIVHPFNIVKGEATALVIDFDADRMVTVTGSGDIIVKPVVKLAVRQEKSSKRQGEPVLVEVSCEEFANIKHVSREVEAAVGEELSVTLCSNPTTGFQWSEAAQISDQTMLQQTDHKLVMPESEPPPPPGTPGQEVWTFQALEKGTTTVSMEYRRPWEDGEEGEWTFELIVTVK